MISSKFLSCWPWRVEIDDNVVDDSAVLNCDGTVQYSQYFSLKKWELDDEKIRIMDSSGQEVMQMTPDHDDKNLRYKSERNGRLIALSRLFPRVGVFVRTHFFDFQVEKALRSIQNNTSYDVMLCTDVSNGFVPPTGIKAHAVSISDFERMGFPQYPRASTSMWHNADYALYSIFDNTDYDYVVMAEYDVAVRGIDLDALFLKLIFQGVDFLAPELRVADNDWVWTARQKRADLKEVRRGSLTQRRTIFRCWFPLVLISRQASDRLQERRREQACLIAGRDWPFCESFVPTELFAADMLIANLNDHLSPPFHLRVIEAINWSEWESSDFTLAHPVVDGATFGRKLVYCSESKGNESEWLLSQVHRCVTPQAKKIVDRRIRFLQSKGR